MNMIQFLLPRGLRYSSRKWTYKRASTQKCFMNYDGNMWREGGREEFSILL